MAGKFSWGAPGRIQCFFSLPEASEVDFGRLLAPTWVARGLWTSPGSVLGAFLAHFWMILGRFSHVFSIRFLLHVWDVFR